MNQQAVSIMAATCTKISMFTVVTVALSIIGALTGITSLLIQFMSYYLNKPKLTCNLSDEHKSYWINGKQLASKDLKSYPPLIRDLASEQYIKILSIVISNNSSNPITIRKIESPNRIVRKVETPLFYPYFYDESGQRFDCAKPTIFPKRIEAYDSIEISIAIFVANFIPNLDVENESITIKTPYKDYDFNFNVKGTSQLIKEENNLINSLRKHNE